MREKRATSPSARPEKKASAIMVKPKGETGRARRTSSTLTERNHRLLRTPRKSETNERWKQFERLIASIQTALSPDAQVRHNHRVVGVSGRQRQLDVSISKNVGRFPIFIVIECKRYARRVTIDRVESFVGKLRDVKGSLGVMISSSGFDAGSKSVASQKGIVLKTFRQAREVDWKAFLNKENWLALTTTEVTNLKAFAHFDDSSHLVRVSLKSPATEGRDGTVQDLFAAWYEKNKPLPGIGTSELAVPFSEGGKIVFQFDVIAKKHLINRILLADVQESVEADGTGQAELITFVIDKDDILQNQPAIDLTPEEYERDREILIQKDITNTKRFIRAGIVKT